MEYADLLKTFNLVSRLIIVGCLFDRHFISDDGTNHIHGICGLHSLLHCGKNVVVKARFEINRLHKLLQCADRWHTKHFKQ